jgi:small-conductance mechanosensitive channel
VALARIEEQAREHDAAMTAARAQLQEQSEEHDAALAVALARIEEQAREHDAALTAARQRLDAQSRELDARVREKEALEDAAEAAHAQLATLRRELEEQRAALEQQRRDADEQRTLASANASTELELLEARSALEVAQAEAQRLTRQFESALEELRAEHVSTLQQQAVARTVLPLDELLTVFESLASASTPSAILTTVVSGLGREFSRVALFRVRGSRLECVSHVGFEFEGDVAKVVIPTSVDSLMTRAVNSRKTQTFVTGTSDEPCAVPFGGSPACAVALPLLSGDAPVAVVYADDSDQLEFGSVPAELLVKFAELVWQHAILVLQRASAAQKTLAVAPVQSFERLA